MLCKHESSGDDMMSERVEGYSERGERKSKHSLMSIFMACGRAGAGIQAFCPELWLKPVSAKCC